MRKEMSVKMFTVFDDNNMNNKTSKTHNTQNLNSEEPDHEVQCNETTTLKAENSQNRPKRRGRPRKYATDEERRAAIARQKREWRERQKLKCQSEV